MTFSETSNRTCQRFRTGGGLEQVLACDIIVAADHAEFGLPEPLRGLIAGSAGVHRLPRQIGLKPAMGYMLTGGI